jgi:hypothetical protein
VRKGIRFNPPPRGGVVCKYGSEMDIRIRKLFYDLLYNYKGLVNIIGILYICGIERKMVILLM